MSLVRVHNLSISIDGFGAGEGQSLEQPFGHAGSRITNWLTSTQTFQRIHGQSGGAVNVDDAFARGWLSGVGADIMGRNMFGPQRGPWQDDSWQGWWGDNPPYHNPVFVLTHHARAAIEMQGGTTFHFVDASPAEAIDIAKSAAGDLDVRISGGPSTVREFLKADLIDFLHVVINPVILGRGVRLWDGLESLEERFTLDTTTTSSGVTHLVGNRR